MVRPLSVLASGLVCLVLACGGAGKHGNAETVPDGAHGAVEDADGAPCNSLDDCRDHPRECGSKHGYACENCSGGSDVCVARSSEEIAELDREKTECERFDRREFSYARGCLCQVEGCPPPDVECQERGGTYSDALGCVTGKLVKPPAPPAR